MAIKNNDIQPGAIIKDSAGVEYIVTLKETVGRGISGNPTIATPLTRAGRGPVYSSDGGFPTGDDFNQEFSLVHRAGSPASNEIILDIFEGRRDINTFEEGRLSQQLTRNGINSLDDLRGGTIGMARTSTTVAQSGTGSS